LALPKASLLVYSGHELAPFAFFDPAVIRTASWVVIPRSLDDLQGGTFMARGPSREGHETQAARVAKRLWPLATVAGTLAALGAMAVPSSATLVSHAKSTLIVKEASNAKLGKILVTMAGRTLYRYTPDTTTTVACTGGCASLWPPLVLPTGATVPTGGTGVTGLGTIKDPSGKLQVTFKGHPLYTYAGDTEPGETNGQGVDNLWFVVTTTTARLATSTTATTSPAPTTSPSSGY